MSSLKTVISPKSFPPAKLYKFMERQWLKPFLSGESILLGTLSDFRNQEKHKLNKGDPNEGRFGIKDENDFMSDNPINAPLVAELASRGVFVRGMKASGIGGNYVSFMSEEHYVFCSSLNFNDEICNDLDDNYDVCVEIGNPQMFMRYIVDSLGGTLGVKALSFVCDKVKYVNRVVAQGATSFEVSPFLKDPIFQIQDEYRLAIVSPAKEANPIPLRVNVTKAETKHIWSR